MGTNTTTQARRFKTAGEKRNVAVAMTGKLDTHTAGDELLVASPVPTAVEVTTTDLTIANVAISTAELVVDGAAVDAGKVVTFSVLGGTAGVTYQITVTATSDAAVAQTLIATVTLVVEADA